MLEVARPAAARTEVASIFHHGKTSSSNLAMKHGGSRWGRGLDPPPPPTSVRSIPLQRRGRREKRGEEGEEEASPTTTNPTILALCVCADILVTFKYFLLPEKYEL